jgi:fatty-acyl-CoA synthase
MEVNPGFRVCEAGLVVLDFLAERVAKFWIPDKVLFIVIDEIPKTSVGKFNKKGLSELYA